MTDSELVIVRGSTPLLVMTVPDKINLSDIADGTITISQKRSGVKIIKKLSEMTFDERNRAYSVFLTQAETLSLDSAWLASIQAKLCDNADVVLVSFMYDVEVLQVNNENILSLDQPSGTAYETPFEGKGIDFLPDLINFQPKIDLESVITSGDYEQLINKPSIGGVTLIGDLSLSDLGTYTKSEIDSTVEEINTKDSAQDTRMNGIDTRIDGVDASIDALDTRADGIDTRIDGVDTRLNNQIGNYVVSRNVESNEYSNSQIDTFFNGFAREIDDLENRIDDQIGLHTLARNVLADEYSNSEIDSKVSAVQGDVDSLETKVNTQLGNYTVSRNVAADEYTNTEIDSALVGKVNTEAGKGLSTNDYTTAEKEKLGALPTASDLSTTINGKVDKITGKGLSTEDYTSEEKNKLSGIETGAQVNVIETVKVNETALPVTNKTVDIDLSNYATKADISAVYKYKGSVTAYADLPTTGQEVGDVYNVETADSTHGIKAGDNVAWNGSAWDVLSGMVDLSGKKNIQTAVVDPTASGNALAFIDSISQDTQGVITATKKTVTTDSTPTSGSTNPVQSGAVKTALDSKANDAVVVKSVNGIQPTNGAVEVTAENIPADGIGDKTVSGNPITVTDALESIAKDLQVEFGPIQEGTPWVGTDTDKVPYNFRAVSDSVVSELGNREHDKLVGGTVAWNQLVPTENRTISNYSYVDTRDYFILYVRKIGAPYTVLLSKDLFAPEHIATITNASASFTGVEILHNGQTSNITFLQFNDMSITQGHKYLINIDFAGVNVQVANGVNGNNIMIVDLTAMFGSTIADYILSLEQSTAGAGVSWFRKLFPAPYYPFDSGTLMSVKTSAHVTRGFNQWDEEWEPGGIDPNTGANIQSNITIRMKNRMPVIPEKTYYLHVGSVSGSSAYIIACFFDKNGNWLTRNYTGGYFNDTIVIPKNAYFMRCYFPSSYGTTYKNDICINLSKTTGTPKNGDYVPYDGHSYALDSDLELRGIPKLDSNNNLYYDGDVYEASGNVQRKYGIVDLGTLNWTYNQAQTRFFADLTSLGIVVVTDTETVANILAKGYRTTYFYDVQVSNDNMVIASYNGYVTVRNVAYTDAASFKTAMSGVYLVYELETPTTETADPYTGTQVIDPDGTEEYVDSRTVAIPVGHVSNYANICPIEGRTETTVTRSDGAETDPDIATASISFGQTVYGGQVDFVTGKCRVTHACTDMGDMDWNYEATNYRFSSSSMINVIKKDVLATTSQFRCSALKTDLAPVNYVSPIGDHTICTYFNGVIYARSLEYTSSDDFKTAYTGQKICYELETPIELTLTPAQLSLLQGTNILTADGTINLTYLGSEASNVQDEIDEFESGLNNVIGSIAFIENQTAKTSHAVGEYIILNGIFCKVIASVSAGETLSFGTNIQATTIGAELRAIWAQISA